MTEDKEITIHQHRDCFMRHSRGEADHFKTLLQTELSLRRRHQLEQEWCHKGTHCIVKTNLFFWQRADYNHLVAALKGDSLCRLYFFCKNPLGLWRHSKSHGARWEDATAFFYSTRVRKLAVNIQHTLRSWKGHRESDCWLTCCVTVCRSVWCPEMEQLRQVCCDRYTLTRLNGEH